MIAAPFPLCLLAALLGISNSSCNGTGGVVQTQSFTQSWTAGCELRDWNAIPCLTHCSYCRHGVPWTKQTIAVGLILLWQIFYPWHVLEFFFNLPRILITLFLLCPSHIPYFHFRFWGKNVKTSVWNVAPRVQNSLSLQK